MRFVRCPIDLYIGILGDEAKAKAYMLVNELRDKGFIVETDYMGKSVKAQMKYANKIGARKTFILGSDELDKQRVSVKDMETGESVEAAFDELENILR